MIPTTTKTLTAPHDAAPLEWAIAVEVGPDRGEILRLTDGRAIVGTSSEADLQLRDPTVSRRHVELRASALTLAVRDLDSRNGTFINEARVRSARCRAGHVVRIGRTVLRVMAVPPREAALVDDGAGIVGRSPAMTELLRQAQTVARRDVTVLVTGETGTGKELLVRAIHRASLRAREPFVVVDLASCPIHLFDDALFGHERGAFTGAHEEAAGAFERAHGGTLFLDELGELPLDAQPRLLRVLSENTVRRLGGSRSREVDVRVVAATHRDLAAEVAASRFRSDLYYRCAVVELHIPPLRERIEDIPLLVTDFLGQLSAAMKRPPPTVPADVMTALCLYDWPGNVRQLRNVLERAIALSGHELNADCLGLDTHVSGPGETPDLSFRRAKDELLRRWERQYLDALLIATHGNVREAARRAGLARSHFYRLLERHDLVRKSRDRAASISRVS